MSKTVYVVLMMFSKFEIRYVKCFTEVCVLKIIQMKPVWGYEIIKIIHGLYGHKFRHGTMYPLFKSLLTRRYVKSRIEYVGTRKRKMYEITPKGLKYLNTYDDFMQKHGSEWKNLNDESV